MKKPLPSFWTARQESAWERVKETLHRDWLETKREYRLGHSNGAEEGFDWDLARYAIRLGHGAATFWVDDTTWREDIEARVRAEWAALASGVSWEEALPLVRYGWELGRKYMASS